MNAVGDHEIMYTSTQMDGVNYVPAGVYGHPTQNVITMQHKQANYLGISCLYKTNYPTN